MIAGSFVTADTFGPYMRRGLAEARASQKAR